MKNSTQTSNAPQVLMVDFKGYLGGGIGVNGDAVVLGIKTQGDSIDITMTKAEAKIMAAKLASAAK
jgi:hypothetical protein